MYRAHAGHVQIKNLTRKCNIEFSRIVELEIGISNTAHESNLHRYQYKNKLAA